MCKRGPHSCCHAKLNNQNDQRPKGQGDEAMAGVSIPAQMLSTLLRICCQQPSVTEDTPACLCAADRGVQNESRVLLL